MNWLKVGFVGTIVTSLCCFTPLLVITLGAIGLAALTPSLDSVLIPILVLFICMTLYGLWRKKNANNRQCNFKIGHHLPFLRFCQRRDYADRCMPILLRMHALSPVAQSQAGRLLCLLLLRNSEVPSYSGGFKMLRSFIHLRGTRNEKMLINIPALVVIALISLPDFADIGEVKPHSFI